MQSLFPQYGNVFGGANGSGRNELVSFNAGKMLVRPAMDGKFLILPDLKKGKVCLTRGDDQLLHFQWIDRQTGASVDDLILFPDDAGFSKVDTGREHDRVYLLQYKNSERRFFFWMQHKDSSRDEELCLKVNEFMNSSSSSSAGDSSRGAGNVQLDHNAIMQMLGAMGTGADHGRSSGGNSSSASAEGGRASSGAGAAGGAGHGVQMADLQNILQGMGLPASALQPQTTSAAPTAAEASNLPSTTSSGAAAAPSSHEHEGDATNMEVEEMSEEELLRLAIEESMRDAGGASGASHEAEAASETPCSTTAPAPDQSAASASVPTSAVALAASAAPATAPAVDAPIASAAASGSITADDLQRAMAAIQAFVQPKGVSLTKLLSADKVAGLLNDDSVVQALLPHLPEGAQTPHELRATLRSPQFRQSIVSLVGALRTSNINAVFANFGLDPSAGAAKLAYGDGVGAFLDAIQAWADKQSSSAENEAKNNE